MTTEVGDGESTHKQLMMSNIRVMLLNGDVIGTKTFQGYSFKMSFINIFGLLFRPFWHLGQFDGQAFNNNISERCFLLDINNKKKTLQH